MLGKGFRFGMLLQLAIGPVCLFVFGTAVEQGFGVAFGAVLGTAVTDGAEILLAILGVSALLGRHPGIRTFFKWFGAAVLGLFGLSSILGAFGIALLPPISLLGAGQGGAFVKAVLLALSNPLTILFWAGIFATKIVEERMQGHDLSWFGAGCVLATLFFLTLVAALGSLTHAMLPIWVIRLLNLLVGCLLLIFAVRSLRRTD